MRSTSGAASSLMSTLILVSHAAFAPFVPHARIISFLSGHAIKISQQSHLSRPPPIMSFNKQDRSGVVTLSEAKGLALRAPRCFAALSMT